MRGWRTLTVGPLVALIILESMWRQRYRAQFLNNINQRLAPVLMRRTQQWKNHTSEDSPTFQTFQDIEVPNTGEKEVAQLFPTTWMAFLLTPDWIILISMGKLKSETTWAKDEEPSFLTEIWEMESWMRVSTRSKTMTWFQTWIDPEFSTGRC